jgi:hypothetical protein
VIVLLKERCDELNEDVWVQTVQQLLFLFLIDVDFGQELDLRDEDLVELDEHALKVLNSGHIDTDDTYFEELALH